MSKIIDFVASHFQAAIASWIINGSGHAVIEAVAGSGKTTTLVEVAAPAIKGEAQFCSFGKAIAEELGSKLPRNFNSRTIHSIAFGAMKNFFTRAQLNNSKYRNLVKNYLQHLPKCPVKVRVAIERGQADFFAPLLKMADLVRLTLTDASDFDAVRDLALHYSVDLPDNGAEQYFLESVVRILDAGRSDCTFEFDFTDTLWLTATDSRVTCKKKFSWVLVDEAQDLNAAQLAVVQKALLKGGRMIFVGDPRQAIMGFAGADNKSLQTIQETMKATTLPLSVCYRCPTSHLDLAREIVPYIENAPNAKKGTVETILRSKLESVLAEGDMVLCRVNSALISLCFSLISDGKPARIKGRDIGKGLISTAKKIATRSDFAGWDAFGSSVDTWTEREIAKLLKRNGQDEADPRIEALTDRAVCLKIIWARSEAQCGQDFECAVNDIFSDDKPGIQLSSVHRAKGLEADSVFILRPDLLPGPWATPGSWQYEQEMNLKYVALTRSKDKLTFVTGE